MVHRAVPVCWNQLCPTSSSLGTSPTRRLASGRASSAIGLNTTRGARLGVLRQRIRGEWLHDDLFLETVHQAPSSSVRVPDTKQHLRIAVVLREATSRSRVGAGRRQKARHTKGRRAQPCPRWRASTHNGKRVVSRKSVLCW